jgi:DNA-binding MarR family transcriptional regulator
MPDTTDLEARADVFGSVFVVAQHLTRRTDAALVDLGLTSRQWLLLAILTTEFRGRRPSLTEAGERYGSSRQNVKQVALGLQARGYLRLVPDPADGRTTRLEVTEQAAVFDTPELQARGAALLDDAFTGLSDDDVRSLQAIVHRWLAALVRPASRPASPISPEIDAHA